MISIETVCCIADLELGGAYASGRRKKGWKNGFGPTEEEKYGLSPRSVLNVDEDSSAPANKHISKVSRHSQMHSNVSLDSGWLTVS